MHPTRELSNVSAAAGELGRESATKGRDCWRLVTVLVTATLVVAGAEWASSQFGADTPIVIVPRPANVTLLPVNGEPSPPPTQRPAVWLLGNSHNFGFPSLEPGGRIVAYQNGITIDHLAAGLAQRQPQVAWDCYLLGYCNFLPFEMLIRTAELLHQGHRPRVVFLGLMWRNLARGSDVRHSISAGFRDSAFCAALETMLSDPSVKGPQPVIDAVRVQERLLLRGNEQTRHRGDADIADQILTDCISGSSSLMTHSAELRAWVFRTINSPFQRELVSGVNGRYFYEIEPGNLEFNNACLLTLLRLLKAHGAEVVCYWVPERTDVGPLMDPQPQESYRQRLAKDAAELGITVLDARSVVPNELWGWVYQSRDRSHFLPAGHARLAEYLLDEADLRQVWKVAPVESDRN